MYVNKKYKESQVTVGSKFIGQIETLDIKLNCTNSTLFITGVYKPHKIDNNIFVTDLFAFLSKFKRRKNHMIVGDININLLVKNDVKEDYLSNLCEFGYKKYIHSVTRPARVLALITRF